MKAPVTASAPAKFKPPPVVKSVPELPMFNARPVELKSMFPETDTRLSKSVCPPKITEVEDVVPILLLNVVQSPDVRKPSPDEDA